MSETRNKAVMGQGNMASKMLFVAEAPGNRDPRPEEQEACINYLKYETYLIEPKIIVCLGRIAAQRIIEPNYRITRAHGSFLYRKGTWLTAVYHPSAILRDDSKMAETRADFEKILEKYRET